MNLKTRIAAAQHAGFCLIPRIVGHAGSAIALSAGRKSATYRRAHAASEPVIVSTRCKAQHASNCAPQKAAVLALPGGEMWQPCSLIIQAKCETFAATEYLSAVLAP
jgi:hypothetical protein